MNLLDIKLRYKGIQSKLSSIDDYGCLFLCLCSIIEEVTGTTADVFSIIQESMTKGWLKTDYTCADSISILKRFTGKRFSRTVAQTLPLVLKENQFTVEKWYNPRTGYTHFKRRFVDTLSSSVTVKEGYIKEYYIYSYA